LLGEQGVRPVPSDAPEGARKGLRIPVNFTEKVLAREQVKLEFYDIGTPASTSDLRVELVEANLLRTVVAFNSFLLEHATNTGGREISDPALLRLMQQENPVTLNSRFAGRKPIPVGFNMSLPGVMVMYLLMNLLIFGGASMATERASGVLRRLSYQPINRHELIFGKLYGLMLLGVVQIVAFLAFGQFLFGVDVGSELPGIVLTLLVFSWVAASLGLLIGSLVTSEDKVVGIGIMLSLPLAALGGCWWPMEIVPEGVRLVSFFTPSAWAMHSLHQLITFGSGIESIVRPVLMLCGFGLVCNLLAARFFRV
jgi:ABC-2 type transport system permease protein